MVFTDPYTVSEMNRWTTPELDDAAAAVRNDVELRVRASRLKDKFLSSAEVRKLFSDPKMRILSSDNRGRTGNQSVVLNVYFHFVSYIST